MSNSSIRQAAFGVCFALCGLSATVGQESKTPDPEKAEGAKPFVHPLFSDHMVIQRNKRVPIWGWTNPGQQVVVQMNGPGLIVTAGADGKWTAGVGPLGPGGPYELKITPYGGGNEKKGVVLTDVMVGDVWICSGQSKMEWSVNRSNNPQEEIAAANHKNLRLYTASELLKKQSNVWLFQFSPTR